MDIGTLILIVIGLGVFETITSIDNAIINAQMLSTMQPWARRWFLVWGLLSAVFLLRGLLPWLIIWSAMPSLGPVDAMTAPGELRPSRARLAVADHDHRCGGFLLF
jgi:uncharacterized protein